MSTAGGPFQVAPADPVADLAALREVRDAVFVVEQGVPVELEHDALDPLCAHVLARDPDGRPIGTGRLTPDARIGRMAVLADWRNAGVGAALLSALIRAARDRGLRSVSLHAQLPAQVFYARHGFEPEGDVFVEAGIEHRTMRLALDAAGSFEDRRALVEATTAVIATARRQLWIYSRDLDPGVFDQAPVVDALRAMAIRTPGAQVQILLQAPDVPQRTRAPLVALAQRLSSVFQFRAVEDPVDLAFAGAYIATDGGGWVHRTLGHRFDGEWSCRDAPRARQLAAQFKPVWERSRPCTELRALGL